MCKRPFLFKRPAAGTAMIAHALAVLLAIAGAAAAQDERPKKVEVRGIELHYIEQGRGEPLILLHGGQSDLHSWGAQMKAFSQHFRVISYSRRYHYPNENPLKTRSHSAIVDADDLAAFIRKLKLGPVHLVGTSYGAFVAMALAVKHPAMVRSLSLSEPTLQAWAKENPAGAKLHDDFMTRIHEPVGRAFKAGDDEGAMRTFVDGMAGTKRFDKLTPEARSVSLRNARFFKAVTQSSDPFPDLPKNSVRKLKMPVLIIRGEHTIPLHRFMNEELEAVLPLADRAVIPKSGHGSARENPEAFNAAVLRFLAKLPPSAR